MVPPTVLPPSTSPVAQEPHITPTPFPTSPLMTVPKLSGEKRSSADDLDSLLKQEGFGVVKLNRESLDNQKALKNIGKHLIIDVKINRVSGSLMVDTGVTNTNIARRRLKNFGLVENKTSYRVTSVIGSVPNKFFGMATLNTLAIGNCVLTNVPTLIDWVPFLDGILGTEEMHTVLARCWIVPSPHFTAPLKDPVATQAANWR